MPDVQSCHGLYIDDSGTKEYAEDAVGYTAGNTRYFVFGGLLIGRGEARNLAAEIKELKRGTFGSADVEIKSTWLRNPTQKRRRYLEPYALGEDDLAKFVDSWYSVVLDTEFQLVAGVVDKLQMQEDYGNPWYPPAIAYDMVLQRAQNELGGSSCTFSVTIDDMSGATPKHNQYRDNLRRQHKLLRGSGSKLRAGLAFTTLVGEVRFMNSAHSELIQVADIAAYNVFRQFQDYGDEWEQVGLKKLPTYEYFAKCLKRFRHDGRGRIQGFGVAKMPRRGRVAWSRKVE